jgi:hypothetical protein
MPGRPGLAPVDSGRFLADFWPMPGLTIRNEKF